jgi:hypothetical protein
MDDRSRRLRHDLVRDTIARLRLRIGERFPGSGLERLAADLETIAALVPAEAEAVARPIWWVWALVVGSVLVLGGVSTVLFGQVRMSEVISWAELAQGVDAITSELALMIALVVFLASWQTRIRRRRVVAGVRRLRELAHIVDMLQLTKDPGGMAGVSLPPTAHSPRRDLSSQELARYLDYCSEMLSLIAKLAQFYVEAFDDPEAAEAVTDLEDLTDGLSRKIWQKIMIIHQSGARSAPGGQQLGDGLAAAHQAGPA